MLFRAAIGSFYGSICAPANPRAGKHEPEPDRARNDGVAGKRDWRADRSGYGAGSKQQPILLKRLRGGRRYGRELAPGDGRLASRGQPHLYIEADAGERDSAESDHFPGG